MPHSSKSKKLILRIRDWIGARIEGADQKAVSVQLFMLLVTIVLTSLAINTAESYNETHKEISELIELGKAGEFELPPRLPSITQGIGALVVGIAFLVSIRLRSRLSELRRSKLTITVFWIAALGVMIAWLPSDFAVTQASLLGKAMGGELPSPWAYAGKLFLIGALILSFPITVMLHYRSSLMDQYVMRNFLTPFAFCLIGFLAIWVIADLLDNVTDLAGASPGTVLTFYLIQIPFMVVFVLPATLLLSLLFSLSKMSTSNELISMIGSGRSVMRVLRPLFLIGVFCALVALVFKYEWAPNSIGYKSSLLSLIKQDRLDSKNKKKKRDQNSADKVSKLGWMHVNEVDKRTWFIGRVPRDLRDKMTAVVIWQMGENGQPAVIWKARTARWAHGLNPPEWWLYAGKTYTYDENGVPRVQSFVKLRLPGLRETPWKVLSSSQNAEHLGFAGLTMYLKSNSDYGKIELAPFLTNWHDTIAEPFWCIVMVLVSAPLGIVYSRRGVLGGVAGSIVIFALMYVTRGTLIALGQASYIPAWLAAWGNNIIFAIVGCILLWFRAQNREIPKLKNLLRGLFTSKKRRSVKPAEVALSPHGISTSGGLDGVFDSGSLRSLDETLAKLQTNKS